MNKRRRFTRCLVLLTSGGMLLQTAGCAAGLLPIVQSVGESVILSLLVSSVSP